MAKIIFFICLTLAVSSCSGIAKSIAKKLPKKLEEAQVYQVSDSVFNAIKLKANNKSLKEKNDNELFVVISFKYLNEFVAQFLEENGTYKNLYPDSSKKNHLYLKYPFITVGSSENILSLKFKFALKTHLVDNSWFEIPYQTEGDVSFNLKPEIKNNKLYFNAIFVDASGSVVNKVGSYLFGDAINLLLDELNGYDIPDDWLRSEKIELENNSLMLAYQINNINADVSYIDQYSIAYKLKSDFMISLSKDGLIQNDERSSGIYIGMDVLQNNIDTILAQNKGKIIIKDDKDAGDLFYFDSVAVQYAGEKLILNCHYGGKFSISPFSLGLDGEMDIWVEPVILKNNLYLKFEKFVFFGPKKDTDLLSKLLNIVISEAVQEVLHVDLSNYLPSETEEFTINERFKLKKINIHLKNGYIKNKQIFLNGKSSAKLLIN